MLLSERSDLDPHNEGMIKDNGPLLWVSEEEEFFLEDTFGSSGWNMHLYIKENVYSKFFLVKVP